MTSLSTLKTLDPAYVSVTYGAGGSTRDRSVEIAKRIKAETGIEVLAHVTCSGSTLDELRALFRELEAAGIQNVLALRGDPPRGHRRSSRSRADSRTPPISSRCSSASSTSASAVRVIPRNIPKR